MNMENGISQAGLCVVINKRDIGSLVDGVKTLFRVVYKHTVEALEWPQLSNVLKGIGPKNIPRRISLSSDRK